MTTKKLSQIERIIRDRHDDLLRNGVLTLKDNRELLAKRLSFSRLHGRVFMMVELVGGEVVGVPVSRYPTLARASVERRKTWRLIGRGIGFSWPALDLDVSVEGILAGQPEVARKPSRVA